MSQTGSSNADLLAENAELKEENATLKAANAELMRLIRGVKSERFIAEKKAADPNSLFAEDEEDEVIEAKRPRKKSKQVGNKRTKIPDKFPRQERILEPDVDLTNMKKIGEVITEQYAFEMNLHVERLVRPKYVDEQSTIHIAPYDNPFPKSNVGVSLATHLAISKYVDHLPLYRLSKMFKRQGADLSRSTLNDAVIRTARLLEPLYEVAQKKVLSADYLMADESSIPVLSRDHPGATLKGQMLIKVAPELGVAAFDYIKTKEKVNILKGLQGFKGYLHTDGNVSYEAMEKEEGVIHLNCLVHARRKFDAAQDYDKERSSYVLEQIQRIYLLERQMRDDQLSADEKKESRNQEIRIILEDLKAWLEKQYRPDLKSNPFNRAVKYTLKRWPKLIKVLEDGRLHPDTNLLERQIRPMVLGRKNYLFAGSHNGARMAAIYYTMFSMCQLNGLNPHKWLTDVLMKISEHKVSELSELLPTIGYKFSL